MYSEACFWYRTTSNHQSITQFKAARGPRLQHLPLDSYPDGFLFDASVKSRSGYNGWASSPAYRS